jgi:hypothetical protein
MPIRLPILRERLAVLSAVVAVILALCVGVYHHGTVHQAWAMLRLPALSPLFADTRTITHSIDCLLSGQNPFIVRSFDPWYRLYNYPPIWLDLRYLGVTSRSSNLLGCLFALMTVIAFLILFRARTWLTAVIVFAAATSKAILFGVERGNTDQVIFLLLIAGIFLIDRQKLAVRTALKSALIVCLTVLKIFPVIAAIILVRNRKSTLWALLTVILSLAALKITSGSQLPFVLANTPQDTFVSFGAFPFFTAVFSHSSHLLLEMVQHHVKAASLGALLLAILSVVAGLRFREHLNRFLPPLDFEDSRGGIAAAGLAIFCLAFIRGSSYDYRLIFLMGAIAYLVEDLNQRKSLRAFPAAILFVLLLWKPANLSTGFELVDGLVFVAACAWLGTSLLDRLGLKLPAPRPQLSVPSTDPVLQP